MPIHSERRDAERLVVIRPQGAFDASETLAELKRHEADKIWTYGTLWDLREMTGRATTDQLWSFSREYTHDPNGRRPERGPIAVVTEDDETYRTVCLYVVMAQGRQQIEVFRDIDEAREWLTSKLAAKPAAASS